MCAQLLIAEDSEDDIYLFNMALKKCAYKRPVHFVRDGTEAISWLQRFRDDSSNSASANNLVLITDLKMPKVGGFELLKWVRSEDKFSTIPVIIYSSSGLPADLSRARALGATHYFQKTVAFSDVIRFLESVAPVV
jgi:CheY-like chemotaxis protein